MLEQASKNAIGKHRVAYFRPKVIDEEKKLNIIDARLTSSSLFGIMDRYGNFIIILLINC
jgi:hypothetical protein